MTTWRPCEDSYVVQTLPVLARSACFDVCSSWSIPCQEIAVTNGGELYRPLFDCEDPHPSAWGHSNYELFPTPNSSTIYNLTLTDPDFAVEASVELGCVGLDGQIPADAHITIECAGSLKKDGKYCGMGCPLALISDPDYAKLKITISVCSWISFFCCLVLGVLWMSPFKRKYPNNLPLFFIICVGISSFALTFGSFLGYEKILCHDDVEPNDFGDAACTIQGILWVYFTLSGVMWWLVLAFNMVITLVSSAKAFMLKYGVYIYQVVWLVPLVPLIIGLANERIGYGGDLWCTVHLTDTTVNFELQADGVHAVVDKNVFYWKVGLVMVPIILCIALGMALTVVLVIFLIVRKELTLKYLFDQWRLAFFVFFYVWLYIFLFIFWGVLRSNIDAQTEAYEDYLKCNFLSGTVYFEELFNGKCEVSEEVSFPLWFIACFILSTQGILIFLIFGTSPGLWKGWGKVFSGKTSFLSGSEKERESKADKASVQSIQSIGDSEL